VVEAALAFGLRPSRDISLWLTPRVVHATVLASDLEQNILGASVGVSGGRDVIVAFELTPAYDLDRTRVVWTFALGLEVPLR